MRLICALCLMVLAMPLAHAQPVKAKQSQLACEALCGELFASIRAEPDKMVMRLEEALVINEACAGEIVTAAIDAVNSEPAMVRKIVDTAMDVAPRRSAAVTAAVNNYAVPEVAMATPVAAAPEQLEVRRAELPEIIRPKPAAGEEVRRAELPLVNQSMPIVEIRRAEAPAAAIPMAEPMQIQPVEQLLNVPKAAPLKRSR
ncbi:MAG: hypothetical protein ACO1TE_10645 [Prosthecobacter sp.]